MNHLRTTSIALFVLIANACSNSENPASTPNSAASSGSKANKTCGTVSRTNELQLQLELFGQFSPEVLKLSPQDGATFNVLTLASRELKVACFEDEPHDGEIQVTSIALMEVSTLSQKCGIIAKPRPDSETEAGRFFLGTMGGRTWIEVNAEDGATLNTLDNLSATQGTACIIANYDSDPGFPVSVKSAAFISHIKW